MDAMISSYQCTYCKASVLDIFKALRPNCSGNLVVPPKRSKNFAKKYPSSTNQIFNPKELKKAKTPSNEYKNIPRKKDKT